MIDITTLPLNAHLGIERSDRDMYILTLKPQGFLQNHVGTMHAVALFALAEATSGEFLIQARQEGQDWAALVRKSSSKYSRPAEGQVFSIVTTSQSDLDSAVSAVEAKGRALFDIDVDVVTGEDEKVAGFQFTWLIAKQSH